MFPEMQTAQTAVANAVVEAIDDEFERVVINYEMARSDEGTAHNRLGFYIVKSNTGFAERDLKFTTQIIDAFTALNEASMRMNKQYWSTCDFVLDSNGRYKMEFSYDPPKRLNGILDEQSYYRFGKKYLQKYIEERTAK